MQNSWFRLDHGHILPFLDLTMRRCVVSPDATNSLRGERLSHETGSFFARNAQLNFGFSALKTLIAHKNSAAASSWNGWTELKSELL